MKRHVLQIGVVGVKVGADEMISLNDLFEAARTAGLAEGKLEPKKWTQKSTRKISGSTGKESFSGGPGLELISFMAETLKVNATTLLRTVRGRTGGTYAHIQIALAYAKYLSPALHYSVNETYLRAKSGDVTLADEIADKATPEQQEWLAKRVSGKAVRRQLTGTLGSHGVIGRGFAECTNAIYIPIVGGTATEIREKKNLPAKANIRETMDMEELARTQLAEVLADKNIRNHRLYGNQECSTECLRAARSVAAVR